MAGVRKVIDCRWFLTGTPCDLEIRGSEEEVLNATIQHIVQFHGHRDTPELRAELRSILRDEDEAKAA